MKQPEPAHHYDQGCLPLPRFERVKYFYGQLLGVREFQSEQAYFFEKHRLHNRYLHGYGVVCGLEVIPCIAPRDPCDEPRPVKPPRPVRPPVEGPPQRRPVKKAPVKAAPVDAAPVKKAPVNAAKAAKKAVAKKAAPVKAAVKAATKAATKAAPKKPAVQKKAARG